MEGQTKLSEDQEIAIDSTQFLKINICPNQPKHIFLTAIRRKHNF